MRRLPTYSYARIWYVVERIPAGSVATYGDVARAAGLPGRARAVGYALHALPPGMDVPWHRVINSRGEISLSGDAAQEQRRRLRTEGVVVHGLRLNLEAFRWTRGRRKQRPEAAWRR
jgi:methylated-DNA-protein-cysteine methyltransferase related protein